MNILIKAPTGAAKGLQKTLVKKLDKIGVDLEGSLEGNIEALSKSIHAAGKAHSALTRKPVFPTIPPPERTRKGQPIEPVEVTKGQPKAHFIKWPVDEIQGALTIEEYSAAQRFRDLFETMYRSEGIANYSEAGISSSAGKTTLIEKKVQGGREYNLMWKELGTALSRDLAENFILEKRPSGADRLLTFEQFGRRSVTSGDAVWCRYAVYSALKCVCERLAYASRQHGIEEVMAQRLSKASGNRNSVRRYSSTAKL